MVVSAQNKADRNWLLHNEAAENRLLHNRFHFLHLPTVVGMEAIGVFWQCCF